MSVTAISLTEGCPFIRSGIRRMWAIPCQAVLDISFDANRQVDGITVDCTLCNWSLLEFEQGTAFVEQQKSSQGNSVNVFQVISFVEPGLSNTVRNALEDLNSNCCLHIIVQTNDGQYMYLGISYYSETDTWNSESMFTSDGSSNTGADPQTESAQYVETIVGSASFYAPFCTGTPSALTTCTECPSDALQNFAGDCLQGFAGDYLTEFP